MTIESFFVIVSMFLFALLAVLYGEKVNNSTVSTVMGTATLATITFMPFVIVAYVLAYP